MKKQITSCSYENLKDGSAKLVIKSNNLEVIKVLQQIANICLSDNSVETLTSIEFKKK